MNVGGRAGGGERMRLERRVRVRLEKVLSVVVWSLDFLLTGCFGRILSYL